MLVLRACFLLLASLGKIIINNYFIQKNHSFIVFQRRKTIHTFALYKKVK